MYNLANHYENIYQYLRTIITDPRVLYLHPFGASQPENIEIIRDDRNPPKRRGPLFIFYDQEPLHAVYNDSFFEAVKNLAWGPYILINTERDSTEKDLICNKFGFAQVDYFFHIFAAHDWYRGHEFLPGLIAPKDRNLHKTYISFNRLTSNERVYRSLFVNELYKNNLLEDGHVSFSKDCPEGGAFDENLRRSVPIHNLDPELITQAVNNINAMPELRIDFAEDDYIPNQSMVLSPLSQLMESFLFVVTETCFWQSKTHLTEKIFKPIVLRMPFVLVGCAHNLAYLRSYGFKTFGDYWDESYDDITDGVARLQAIAKIIKDINSMSKKQQKSMLSDMQPILEHNYKLFNNPAFIRSEWNHLTKSLSDISKMYDYNQPYTLDLRTRQAIPV